LADPRGPQREAQAGQHAKGNRPNTEVHMLFFEAWDNERKWMLYLGLSEVAKAILSLLALSWAPPIMRASALMAAVWFSVQAQQEFTGNNTGSTQTWKYWLVSAMALVVLIQIKYHREK
jgi:hypothetical protein